MGSYIRSTRLLTLPFFFVWLCFWSFYVVVKFVQTLHVLYDNKNSVCKYDAILDNNQLRPIIYFTFYFYWNIISFNKGSARNVWSGSNDIWLRLRQRKKNEWKNLRIIFGRLNQILDYCSTRIYLLLDTFSARYLFKQKKFDWSNICSSVVLKRDRTGRKKEKFWFVWFFGVSRPFVNHFLL